MPPLSVRKKGNSIYEPADPVKRQTSRLCGGQRCAGGSRDRGFCRHVCRTNGRPVVNTEASNSQYDHHVEYQAQRSRHWSAQPGPERLSGPPRCSEAGEQLSPEYQQPGGCGAGHLRTPPGHVQRHGKRWNSHYHQPGVWLWGDRSTADLRAVPGRAGYHQSRRQAERYQCAQLPGYGAAQLWYLASGHLLADPYPQLSARQAARHAAPPSLRGAFSVISAKTRNLARWLTQLICITDLNAG